MKKAFVTPKIVRNRGVLAASTDFRSPTKDQHVHV